MSRQRRTSVGPAKAPSGKTGKAKTGIRANALAGIACKKLPNPKIARLESVIRGPSLLNPVRSMLLVGCVLPSSRRPGTFHPDPACRTN